MIKYSPALELHNCHPLPSDPAETMDCRKCFSLELLCLLYVRP